MSDQTNVNSNTGSSNCSITRKTLQKKAEDIADDLLAHPGGQTGTRLILEVDGRDAGGYGRASLIRMIMRHLRENNDGF